MTRETALKMLSQYCDAIKTGMWITGGEMPPVMKDAAGMADRFPEDGSEKKAMRWLGYMQGVLVCSQVFSLDEVKEHSKRGSVHPEAAPWKGDG